MCAAWCSRLPPLPRLPPRQRHPPRRRIRPDSGTAHGMAEHFSRDRLLPALLDRLVDDRPHEASEAIESRVLSKAGLRQSVLRDLAWLFNAQAAVDGTIDGDVFPHALHSTI